jgi:hypothetical protein
MAVAAAAAAAAAGEGKGEGVEEEEPDVMIVSPPSEAAAAGAAGAGGSTTIPSAHAYMHTDLLTAAAEASVADAYAAEAAKAVRAEAWQDGRPCIAALLYLAGLRAELLAYEVVRGGFGLWRGCI